MVGTVEGSLEYKKIVNLTNLLKYLLQLHLVLLDFFIFLKATFFYLFVLASVVDNHKSTTAADLLNKISRVLMYTPDKIGAGGRGKTVDNNE